MNHVQSALADGNHPSGRIILGTTSNFRFKIPPGASHHMSRPGFWDPVSEGIRQANPVLVTNCFKKSFIKKLLSV